MTIGCWHHESSACRALLQTVVGAQDRSRWKVCKFVDCTSASIQVPRPAQQRGALHAPRKRLGSSAALTFYACVNSDSNALTFVV